MLPAGQAVGRPGDKLRLATTGAEQVYIKGWGLQPAGRVDIRGATAAGCRRQLAPGPCSFCRDVHILKGTMMVSNDPQDGNPVFASTASRVSANVAAQADKAIVATQHVADRASTRFNQRLDSLREDLPFALSRAGASADALLAEGAERARETADAIRRRAEPLQHQAEAYIRRKPMQSVLLAAGVGALITLLLTRSSGR